jgi:lactoylglutathione lyase
MFSHVFAGVADFERAFAFYEGVLGELGLEVRFHEPGRPWAGWHGPGGTRPYFGAYFRDPEGNKVCVASHGES